MNYAPRRIDKNIAARSVVALCPMAIEWLSPERGTIHYHREGSPTTSVLYIPIASATEEYHGGVCAVVSQSRWRNSDHLAVLYDPISNRVVPLIAARVDCPVFKRVIPDLRRNNPAPVTRWLRGAHRVRPQPQFSRWTMSPAPLYFPQP